MIDKLDKFHKTKAGYLVFGLVELGLAYIFVSWAVNSGSLWDYLLALLLFVGSLTNIVKLIGLTFSGKHKTN